MLEFRHFYMTLASSGVVERFQWGVRYHQWSSWLLSKSRTHYFLFTYRAWPWWSMEFCLRRVQCVKGSFTLAAWGESDNVRADGWHCQTKDLTLTTRGNVASTNTRHLYVTKTRYSLCVVEQWPRSLSCWQGPLKPWMLNHAFFACGTRTRSGGNEPLSGLNVCYV